MQWKPENMESFLPVPHRDGCLSMAKIKGKQQGYSCHSAINPISAAEYMHSNLYCLIRHILRYNVFVRINAIIAIAKKTRNTFSYKLLSN